MYKKKHKRCFYSKGSTGIENSFLVNAFSDIANIKASLDSWTQFLSWTKFLAPKKKKEKRLQPDHFSLSGKDHFQ